MRGHRAGAVPSANAGLAEERAVAALRTRLHHLQLPHAEAAFESNAPTTLAIKPANSVDRGQEGSFCSVLQVKKIFESERRLHAGNHSVELLAQDFEKNYNMYIYPVHWQFAQLDQHPSDRCVYNLQRRDHMTPGLASILGGGQTLGLCVAL